MAKRRDDNSSEQPIGAEPAETDVAMTLAGEEPASTSEEPTVGGDPMPEPGPKPRVEPPAEEPPVEIALVYDGSRGPAINLWIEGECIVFAADRTTTVNRAVAVVAIASGKGISEAAPATAAAE